MADQLILFRRDEALIEMPGTVINGFKVSRLEEFPPMSNPNQHDEYHNVVDIGKDVAVLCVQDDEKNRYLILLHKPSGQRIRILVPTHCGNHPFCFACQRIRKESGFDNWQFKEGIGWVYDK